MVLVDFKKKVLNKCVFGMKMFFALMNLKTSFFTFFLIKIKIYTLACRTFNKFILEKTPFCLTNIFPNSILVFAEVVPQKIHIY